MRKFVIQKILHPQNKPLPIRDLYYKAFPGLVDFYTYFNSFPIVKWEKYTRLSNLHLYLSINGTCRLNFFEDFKEPTLQKQIISHIFTSSIDIEIPYQPNSCCLLGFSLSELSDDFNFTSGHFYTQIEPHDCQDIKLGIGICTFKREKYLIHNLDILQKNILQNPESILFNNLDIYVADNGNSVKDVLDENNIKLDRHIHLFHNINAGGSAGFTRCIIEFLKKKFSPTHILLMDDDVSFETESIERTASFLTLIKNEYKSDIIGGAMLKEEAPVIQFESGAKWSLTHYDSPQLLGSNLDLTEIRNVKSNLDNLKANYNAWFYCCIPTKTFEKHKLPLPFFIHYDDIEYGIRCNKNIININGICVWHPTESKYSPTMTYYDTRNSLITSFLWDANKNTRFSLIFLCLKKVLDTTTTYRFIDWSLFYKAVHQVLCRTNEFASVDPLLLHTKISSQKYEHLAPSNVLCKKKYISENEERHITSYFSKIGIKQIIDASISLFLLLLPTYKSDISIMNSTPPFFHPFFRGRKKVYIYDKKKNMFFLLKKESNKIFLCSIQFFILCLEILFLYNHARKKTKKQFEKTTTVDYWTKYLKLNQP